MRRLTIFAKGNADVAGSLHALREGEAVTWNGINDVLRETHPHVRARVIHETMGGSAAVLAAPGNMPVGVEDLPLGADPVIAQFGRRLFETPADVVVLSIQPDVMNRLVRHRADGHLLYPHALDGWSAPDRARLVELYEPVPPTTPEASMAALQAIVAALRPHGDPAIVILNMSPVVPWETLHCFAGVGETLSSRIRRFNLALEDLSRATGVSIVDVDRLVATAGAARTKLDVATLTAEGCRLVATEVVRILADRGLLGEDA